MEKERRTKFSILNIAVMAVLVAMQIVLARFAGIQINEGLRLSFESIPIILAGFWLGPVGGMLVAAVADFLGWLVSGYGVYFPLYTVGPVLLGLLSGIGAKLFLKGEPTWKSGWKAILLVLVAEVCSSLLYGTWALTLYYSIIVGKEVPFSVLFLTRISTKPVTMVLDALLAFLIHKAVYRTVVCKVLRRPAPKQN